MTRERKVFNDYDSLVAAWVAGTQESGRTRRVSGNHCGWRSRGFTGVRLTFAGDTLLSYGHFPIARKVSPGVAFITTRYWTTTVLRSPTTEKHKLIATRQLERAGFRIFELDAIETNDHESQLANLQSQCVETITRWKVSRFPGRFQWEYRKVAHAIAEVKAFAKTFSLPYDRRWLIPHLAPVVRKRVPTFKAILVHKTLERLGARK